MNAALEEVPVRYAIAFALSALIAVLLVACVKPILDEDTGKVGVAVVPLADMERVQEGERIAEEMGAALAAGQIELAQQLENDLVAARTEIAAQKAEMDRAILAAKDEAATNWLDILLAAAGGGVVGGGVVGGGGVVVASKKKKVTP